VKRKYRRMENGNTTQLIPNISTKRWLVANAPTDVFSREVGGSK